jgi:hypothetical protein
VETVADQRSRTLQQNEKTKCWSTVVTNLGSALLASAFGRWWLVGIDLWVIIWGVLAVYVIRVGIYVLGHLEAETWDG